VTANILYLLLATRNANDFLLFREALEDIRFSTQLECVEDSRKLMEHFTGNPLKLPHIVFMETGLPYCGGLGCLTKIRDDNAFSEVVLTVYSSTVKDESVEEAFTSGANIFLTRPADFLVMKNHLIHIISVLWQYHAFGLRKDFFLLNVGY
jgi:PleD family two-component response regulator